MITPYRVGDEVIVTDYTGLSDQMISLIKAGNNKGIVDFIDDEDLTARVAFCIPNGFFPNGFLKKAIWIYQSDLLLSDNDDGGYAI